MENFSYKEELEVAIRKTIQRSLPVIQHATHINYKNSKHKLHFIFECVVALVRTEHQLLSGYRAINPE